VPLPFLSVIAPLYGWRSVLNERCRCGSPIPGPLSPLFVFPLVAPFPRIRPPLCVFWSPAPFSSILSSSSGDFNPIVLSLHLLHVRSLRFPVLGPRLPHQSRDNLPILGLFPCPPLTWLPPPCFSFVFVIVLIRRPTRGSLVLDMFPWNSRASLALFPPLSSPPDFFTIRLPPLPVFRPGGRRAVRLLTFPLWFLFPLRRSW